MNGTRYPLLCLLTWLPLLSAQATPPESYTFTMTANVVQSASCSLNEGKDVAVSFGDRVDIASINGVNYQTNIAYNLRCDSLGKNAITLEIDGTNADFGQGMLYVSPGLGIKIVQGDSLLPINTPLAIDGANPPVLMAVPVKKPGVILTPGAFEASATIKAIYE